MEHEISISEMHLTRRVCSFVVGDEGVVTREATCPAHEVVKVCCGDGYELSGEVGWLMCGGMLCGEFRDNGVFVASIEEPGGLQLCGFLLRAREQLKQRSLDELRVDVRNSLVQKMPEADFREMFGLLGRSGLTVVSSASVVFGPGYCYLVLFSPRYRAALAVCLGPLPRLVDVLLLFPMFGCEFGSTVELERVSDKLYHAVVTKETTVDARSRFVDSAFELVGNGVCGEEVRLGAGFGVLTDYPVNLVKTAGWQDPGVWVENVGLFPVGCSGSWVVTTRVKELRDVIAGLIGFSLPDTVLFELAVLTDRSSVVGVEKSVDAAVELYECLGDGMLTAISIEFGFGCSDGCALSRTLSVDALNSENVKKITEKCVFDSCSLVQKRRVVRAVAGLLMMYGGEVAVRRWLQVLGGVDPLPGRECVVLHVYSSKIHVVRKRGWVDVAIDRRDLNAICKSFNFF